MKNSTFFRDKVIIVTGASSGIGKDLALRLSQSGARVVLAARNEAKLIELEKQIQASGKEAIAVKTDISVEKEVSDLVAITLEKWDRIDIYISNAGHYFQGLIHELSADVFRRSFDVNFFASLYAVKKIIPVMKDQKSGFIVFINTLNSKKGIIGDSPYVAAKSALDGFGDVLRQEVKEMGIKVLTVYPGRVDTPMIEDIQVPWISPKIPPGKVVNAVIAGIVKEKPVIVVPKLFYLLGALNNLSPRLMDWFYRKFRLEGVKKMN